LWTWNNNNCQQDTKPLEKKNKIEYPCWMNVMSNLIRETLHWDPKQIFYGQMTLVPHIVDCLGASSVLIMGHIRFSQQAIRNMQKGWYGSSENVRRQQNMWHNWGASIQWHAAT
jgi:hypothetical protein